MLIHRHSQKDQLEARTARILRRAQCLARAATHSRSERRRLYLLVQLVRLSKCHPRLPILRT